MTVRQTSIRQRIDCLLLLVALTVCFGSSNGAVGSGACSKGGACTNDETVNNYVTEDEGDINNNSNNKKERLMTETYDENDNVYQVETVDNPWGVPQIVFDTLHKETHAVLIRMESYMKGEGDSDHSDNIDTSVCKNNDEWCADWTARGYCETNSDWMSINCAPSCQTCHEMQKTPQRLLLDENGEELKEFVWGTTNNRNETKTSTDGESLFHEWDTLPLFQRMENPWGVPQIVFDAFARETYAVLDRMETYMTGRVLRYLTTDEASQCQNVDEWCTDWAARGECETNDWMIINCAPSCQTCHVLFSDDHQSHLDETGDELFDIPWGEAQIVYSEHREQVLKIITEMNDYMANEVSVSDDYASVKDDCKCVDTMCSVWAATGECEQNPTWMNVNCGPICKTCELLDYNARCPKADKLPTAVLPGELNSVFEEIMDDPTYGHYSPSILTSPETKHNDNSPWIIQLDTFATKEECDRLITHGKLHGYEESMTIGYENPDGTVTSFSNPHRTSGTAWCEGHCHDDSMVQNVLLRIEDLTRIPTTYYEYLQVLRYKENQFYSVHNDYLPTDVDKLAGARILTLYLFLNDVEEGGEIRFPLLDVTIKPKRGRAILWPSVTNIDPSAREDLTDHETLPVIKGTKYGAYTWIHQHDYKVAHEAGCN